MTIVVSYYATADKTGPVVGQSGDGDCPFNTWGEETAYSTYRRIYCATNP